MSLCNPRFAVTRMAADASPIACNPSRIGAAFHTRQGQTCAESPLPKGKSRRGFGYSEWHLLPNPCQIPPPAQPLPADTRFEQSALRLPNGSPRHIDSWPGSALVFAPTTLKKRHALGHLSRGACFLRGIALWDCQGQGSRSVRLPHQTCGEDA